MYVRTSNPANASNANPGWPPAGSSGADTNARAGNDEPIRSAPRQRARHPTLSALIELKPELPPVVSPFVANLEAFDQRHDASLTNAQVITPFARMNPDAEVQVAMRRKASFCLIREVLQDINKLTDVDKSACYGSRADPLVRHMLTAQVDALQKQVTSNRTDAYNKIMQGKRLCPLFMQTPASHHFMQSETNALRNIVSLCGRSGPRRNIDISDALSEFAQRYLAVTNRKPAHLKPNQSVTYFNAATFTNCSVGV